MFWQNKKKFDFSSLIFDSRNILAASLKSLQDFANKEKRKFYQETTKRSEQQLEGWN